VIANAELVVIGCPKVGLGEELGERISYDQKGISVYKPVSVKLVSKAPVRAPGLFHFSPICRIKESEPPRTRTWNLEIKSLLLCQLS
jgi:hypothetical protein